MSIEREECSVTDTLIADADSVFHPALTDDRLLLGLGLRGTMSEAELNVMQTRLRGGARNKAARGELRLQMPTGYLWKRGEPRPEINPDEAISGAIRTIFRVFAEKRSIRQVWLWMRAEDLKFPQFVTGSKNPRWVTPSYTAVREVLISPVYAGTYVYGRYRTERYVDEHGQIHRRRKKVAPDQWSVLVSCPRSPAHIFGNLTFHS